MTNCIFRIVVMFACGVLLNQELAAQTNLCENGKVPVQPSNETPGDNAFIAAGRFNADQRKDLVVLNPLGKKLVVLLAQTDNTYQPATGTPLALDFSPVSVAVADLNNDGKDDLVVPSLTESKLVWFAGTGLGPFAAPQQIPLASGSSPSFFVAADFNRDGKTDFAIVNWLGGSVDIYLGAASGSFTKSASYLADNKLLALSVADLNADQQVDLVVTSGGANKLPILLGRNDGSFQLLDTAPTIGANTVTVVTGDFNNDAKVDLATVNASNNQLRVFLGGGTGAFSEAAGSPLLLTNTPDSLLIGDFNADGKQDLVIPLAYQPALLTLFGNGDGTFNAPVIPVRAALLASFALASDLNSDGSTDVVVAESDDRALLLLFGQCLLDPPPLSGTVITLAQTVQPGSVAVNDNVTYTLTIKNEGSLVAQGVTLIDELPDTLTFVSCATTGKGLCGGTGNSRVITFLNVAPGALATVTIVARVNCYVSQGAQIKHAPALYATFENGTTLNKSVETAITISNPDSPMITPQENTFFSTGGSGNVNVTLPSSCAWQPVSLHDWITVQNPANQTGNGTFSYTVAPNPLPDARTGVIQVAGQTFTVTQTGGCTPIIITPTTLTAGTAGTPYPVTTLMPSGGVAPYTFTIPVGSLPNNMTLSPGGVLEGTPNVSGTFNFTARATDSGGVCFGEKAYSLVINPGCMPITVNPATLPNGFVGTLYNQPLNASGGTPSYAFMLNSGSFPPGLNIVGTNLTGTPTTTGVFSFTIKATDSMGCMGTRAYTVVISGTGLQFYPLAHPVRMVDTRVGATACQTPGAAITGNTSLTVPARGVCDGLTIPANAAAVTGNVTTVGPVAAGFLTIYPSGATRPQASNSNYQTNQTLNNVFTVGLGAADGAFNVYALSTTNVVVDVTGYFAPPGANGLFFHPLPAPVRLLDTRAGQTACTTPGTPLLAATEFQQQGNAICGIPATALALVGNATTVGPLAQGFLTLFPADATRPNIASGNYQLGQTLNSPFTVGLSPSGQFKIYSLQQTNLVVDVLGYYSADASDTVGIGLLFSPMTPARLLDTRAGQTACFTPGVAIPATTDTPQAARGTCTIPATAQAIVGNATTVSPASGGFLTFWPSNATRPNAATSNFAAGVNFNRHYTVGLGADGAFNIYALTSTHLVVDVSGSFAP